MKINKTNLINGLEVDMPMMRGEFQTSRAIRYVKDGKIDGYAKQNDGVFQLYNFQTNENIYCSVNLKAVVEYTNQRYGLNDSVI